MQKKGKKLLIVALVLVVTLAVLIPGMNTNAATSADYLSRFNTLYNELQGNGYLSPEGVPYHSIETLMCEAPDYGHETTSEAFSFMTWLAAVKGKISGSWTDYQNAWNKTEQYMIPSSADQPGFSTYNPNDPADYAPEADDPSQYPTNGDSSFPTGIDPTWSSLSSTYGSTIYQMHWLMDVDNWYKYGKRGDQTSRCGFINTYQRGPQESCWETVPHPSWEDFDFGAGANGGFLPIFFNFGTPAKQWRYTSASDADARQVQASYWANVWAKEQGVNLSTYNQKAAKMGDFLRGTFFDKYFRPLGVQTAMTKGTGYDSCMYLLTWYMSWGGDINGQWAFKIGSSFAHQGYQNPLCAWVMANDPDFAPRAANGKTDWATSLTRQIEFYQWLQSSEGAIAGGCSNSWGGRYLAYPSGASQFYKMCYDEDPVYHDPPSNNWFGMQVWGMDRMIEYYYVTGDAKAKAICDKWVNWVLSVSSATATSFTIPSTLSWSGQPDTWTGTPTANSNLRCSVAESTSSDVGTCAGLVKCLIYYAAAYKKHTGTAHAASLTMATNLLDALWSKKAAVGCVVPEDRADYARFLNQVVYIPPSFTGTNGQGAQIKNGMTFIDMRPAYRNDPQWSKVTSSGATGLIYHRYWAQADIAICNALMYIYFGDGGPTPTTGPTPTGIQNTPTPTRRVATPTPTRRVATPTPTRRGATPTPTRRAATPTPTRVVNTPTPTRVVNTPTPTSQSGGYVVAYVISSDWGSGATINVTIINNTTSAVNGWTLAFTFPGNQVITNLWNGAYTQSGASVSVKDAGYNANIPANGGSTNFGFNINYSGANAKPTSFTLNGVACQVQ
ncbi:MAG: cellulose binding domain-containing protein [Firmicutes bacterium]|nr:cellulose binding domain-containing protein [Bacillota bacterium]